ncbi:MAG TPA: hypothetical protein PK725_11795 [Rhodocyclaceae bacterium]|nr:hypothetical protein [Rhodocyclaceae bacterium]HRQ47625.1 hypothetical protein [Rhodocyclaceae bacterium]
MHIALQRSAGESSLSRQYLLVSTLILLVGMVATGAWLGRQIETSAVNRAASVAAVYTESILAAHLRSRGAVHAMVAGDHAELDRLFVDGPLRRKVVRFKLWSADGSIVYSSDHAQQGLRFAVQGPLAEAFGGSVQARLTRLEQADNVPEREHWPQLLEVYVPVRGADSEEVIAVAEFYHATDNLFRDIGEAQRRSWILVAVAAIALYASLRGFVRSADHTISDQQQDLQRQLRQLRAALDENERIRGQLREAGARTTALNEQLLHRIAADLHDGPAQKIAFALMRYGDDAPTAASTDAIRDALQSSLVDVRDIAAGLGVPVVDSLSLADTVRRAVRDFERQFSTRAGIEVDDALGAAPLAVKITAYRFVQESLNNCQRHAPEAAPMVRAWRVGADALIEVVDRGQGFDPDEVAASGRLGLAFMQERVRLLGGSFELDTGPGRGTTLRARLPIDRSEHGDA